MTKVTMEDKNNDMSTVVIDSQTRIPLYAVYSICALIVFLTGYIVRLDVLQVTNAAAQESRLNQQSDFLIKHDQLFRDITHTQGEISNRLAEVVGELKYLRETRSKTK